MDLMEAIRQRHSVRNYTDQPITDETLDALTRLIDQCNQESGLHIQLVLQEPKAFDSRMARYGKFSGVKNYIAMIGKKGKKLDELCGYYGEKIVLEAQRMGLNTCWVGLTFKKIPEAFIIEKGEKLVIVIAIGYGVTQGVAHKTKQMSQVTKVEGSMPDWFEAGVEAALLAPTAVNQQKFTFVLQGDNVVAKAGLSPYAKVDLGIVKYHFEVGSGKSADVWVQD